MDIYIEPTSVSFDIVKVTYEIISLVPNQSCNISAYLTEANGNRVKRYNLTLSSPEYNQWGTDDTFLINWICAQCGLTKQNPPPEIIIPDPIITDVPSQDPTFMTEQPVV